MRNGPKYWTWSEWVGAYIWFALCTTAALIVLNATGVI